MNIKEMQKKKYKVGMGFQYLHAKAMIMIRKFNGHYVLDHIYYRIKIIFKLQL